MSFLASSFLTRDMIFKGEVEVKDNFSAEEAAISITHLSTNGNSDFSGEVYLATGQNSQGKIEIGSIEKNIPFFIKSLPVCAFPKLFLCIDETGKIATKETFSFDQRLLRLENTIYFDAVLVNDIRAIDSQLLIDNKDKDGNPVDIIIGDPNSTIFFSASSVFFNADLDSHDSAISFIKPVLLKNDFTLDALKSDTCLIEGRLYAGSAPTFRTNLLTFSKIDPKHTVFLNSSVVFDSDVFLHNGLSFVDMNPSEIDSYFCLSVEDKTNQLVKNDQELLFRGNQINVNSIFADSVYTNLNNASQCIIGNESDVNIKSDNDFMFTSPITIDVKNVLNKGIYFSFVTQNESLFSQKMTFANIPKNGFSLRVNVDKNFIIDSSVDTILMDKDNFTITTSFYLGYAVLEKNTADNSFVLKILKTSSISSDLYKNRMLNLPDQITLFSKDLNSLSDLSLISLGIAQVSFLYNELAAIKDQLQLIFNEKRLLLSVLAQKKEELAYVKKLAKEKRK